MDLNQITIPSMDVERGMRFYEALGLKLIVNSLPHYVRFECPNGNSTFSIHKVDQPDTSSGVNIYFEVEDVDKTVAELQSMGIEFDELPELKGWLWKEARLKDPDANQVIIYYAGDYRKNPPWRIKENQ